MQVVYAQVCYVDDCSLFDLESPEAELYKYIYYGHTVVSCMHTDQQTAAALEAQEKIDQKAKNKPPDVRKYFTRCIDTDARPISVDTDERPICVTENCK